MARKPMGKYCLRELLTVLLMIDLYEKHHPAEVEYGDRYPQLSAYATNRLERCQFGEEKPACKHSNPLLSTGQARTDSRYYALVGTARVIAPPYPGDTPSN